MMPGRFEHLRNSGAGNRRSLPDPKTMGFNRMTERVDERALSSASTPVHNLPPGAAKSPFSMASRQSIGGTTSYHDDLATQLPRRYSNNNQFYSSAGTKPGLSSVSSPNFPPALVPRSGTPTGGMLAQRTQTPTRDENETPNGKRAAGLARPGSGEPPGQGAQSQKLGSGVGGSGGSPAASRSTKDQGLGAKDQALGGAFQMGVAYPLIEGRLHWASVRIEVTEPAGEHWFTTDRLLIYSAFCADFGPMNLSAVHRFCKIMRDKMASKELKGKKIVCWTGATPQLRTNCVFLLGSYLCTELDYTPEQCQQMFQRFEPSPFLGYRDATFVRSTWDLQLVDCWRGLLKGIKTGLIDLKTFNPDEYDYYDHPQHGDMHVIVPGKFIAFKGPTARRLRLAPGVFSHTPKDYVEVFRHHKVSAIVRLNSKEYDRQDFVRSGFNHHDLFFEDCTTPNEQIVKRFFECVEKEKGVTAVHCLAGLGRTGTLIGLWIMKHHDFTAQEVIAYLRIMRPGSIIGPQQQYLVAAAAKVKAGQLGGGAVSVGGSGGEAGTNLEQSEALAKEVKDGMLRRHMQRVPSVSGDVVSGASPIISPSNSGARR